MILNFKFQHQIFKFAISRKRMGRSTLLGLQWGQKFDLVHNIDFNFMVKYFVCYFSGKYGPIATNPKSMYRLNARAQLFCTSVLTLVMILTFSRSCLRAGYNQWLLGWLSCLCAINSSSLLSAYIGWIMSFHLFFFLPQTDLGFLFVHHFIWMLLM